MLSSNLSVNVRSPDSLDRNTWRRHKFRHKLSEVPTPTWTTKAVPNLTLRINNLTTPLPSGLVKMLGHSSFLKWCSHLIHSPFTQTLRESKIRAKGEGKECFSCLGAVEHEVTQLWNESFMVRSEERNIYTPSENPTVQIYVESSDVDLRTSDDKRKHCTQRVGSQCM